MANINARSPYLVRAYDSNRLTSCEINLWVYKGTQLISHTSDPTYTLTSTAINNEVVFDIAPLVKDYFDINFDGNYNSEVVWVDYQLNLYEDLLTYTFGSKVYDSGGALLNGGNYLYYKST